MEKLIVLVVEDEAIIRMDAVQIVEDAGFAVLDACNADEAIAILESRDDIRAVFTDINMAGSMNGLKLARAIRDRWPPIHLLVASGPNVPDTEQLPERAIFVRKPYTPQHITDALHVLFGHSPAPAPRMNDDGHKCGKVA